jgi:hypothetical protein
LISQGKRKKRGRIIVRPRRFQCSELVAEAKIAYDLAVGVHISAPKVCEKPASPANHFEQPTTSVMVLDVRPEMIGEEVDSFGEKCHLNFGGSGICWMLPIFIEAR